MSKRWYVVHAYSGFEKSVQRALDERIQRQGMQDVFGRVLVPVEEVVELKLGQKSISERKFFPGYVLVRMEYTDDSWGAVRHTPGVTGFVGSGKDPTPLLPDEVAKIKQRMEAGAPRVKVSFRTGSKVRITEGPFSEFIGTVDTIDNDRRKVRVMVNFFGRDTPIELDFLQVEEI